MSRINCSSAVQTTNLHMEDFEVLRVSYCDHAVSVVHHAACVVRRQHFTLCTL